mmetsp:Transcript_39248/g.118047  ORF Transcript_39248/g.118047 Transcript_39248/m.118047 type:complete len:118 (+) Transcript_39248:1050-1403(+)
MLAELGGLQLAFARAAIARHGRRGGRRAHRVAMEQDLDSPYVSSLELTVEAISSGPVGATATGPAPAVVEEGDDVSTRTGRSSRRRRRRRRVRGAGRNNLSDPLRTDDEDDNEVYMV